MIGKFCLIRTYSAGVHVGTVVHMNGREVTLGDARRIWSWSGRNTLSEISLHGVGDGSRVSEPVPEILLTEAIEVIPCSYTARENLSSSRWS